MSPFGKLDQKDFIKSLVVAVLVAVLAFVQNILENKGLDLNLQDLQQVGQVALTALVGYLAKNLLSNSKDQFGKKESVS